MSKKYRIDVKPAMHTPGWYAEVYRVPTDPELVRKYEPPIWYTATVRDPEQARLAAEKTARRDALGGHSYILEVDDAAGA